MIKKYSIFVKQNENGKVEDTLFLLSGFNFYALIAQLFFVLFVYFFYLNKKLVAFFFILSLVFYVFYPINVLFSIIIGFKFNYILSKIYINSGYEYLGWANGKNKQEAKQVFIKGLNN